MSPNKRDNRLKPTPLSDSYHYRSLVYVAMKPVPNALRLKGDDAPICRPRMNGSRVSVYMSYSNALHAADRRGGGYVVALDLTKLPRAADDRVSNNEDEDGFPIDEPEHVDRRTSDLEFAERQFSAWAEIIERLRRAAP